MSRHVFVAGPYSGDTAANTRRAIHAADALLAAGWIPFVPHLYHYWNLAIPHQYEDWMALDAAWLERCAVLVRLPGESPGADREVALARRLGMAILTLEEALERSHGDQCHEHEQAIR